MDIASGIYNIFDLFQTKLSPPKFNVNMCNWYLCMLQTHLWMCSCVFKFLFLFLLVTNPFFQLNNFMAQHIDMVFISPFILWLAKTYSSFSLWTLSFLPTSFVCRLINALTIVSGTWLRSWITTTTWHVQTNCPQMETHISTASCRDEPRNGSHTSVWRLRNTPTFLVIICVHIDTDIKTLSSYLYSFITFHNHHFVFILFHAYIFVKMKYVNCYEKKVSTCTIYFSMTDNSWKCQSKNGIDLFWRYRSSLRLPGRGIWGRKSHSQADWHWTLPAQPGKGPEKESWGMDCVPATGKPWETLQ